MADDEMLLKMDIANRPSMMPCRGRPDLLRWARWCLDGANHAYYDNESIMCSRGVQRGDPLASMLFSLSLSLSGVSNRFFLKSVLTVLFLSFSSHFIYKRFSFSVLSFYL